MRYLRRVVLLASCGAVLLTSGKVHAETWPRIVGEQSAQECQASLRLAKAVFLSREHSLRPPGKEVPANFGSVRVFGGVAGSEDPLVDPQHFDVSGIEEEGSARPRYWQKKPIDRQRLLVEAGAIREQTAYAFKAIDQALDLTAYRELSLALDNGTPHPQKNAITDLSLVMLEVPEIFQELKSGQYWALVGGSLADASSPWEVFATRDGIYKRICEIKFRTDVQHVRELLPQQVRKLELLLDRSVGRSYGRTGSFNQFWVTSLEQTWSNAINRPWASLSGGEHTREEIDAELRRWARLSRYNSVTYSAIRRQLPLAERALANHYSSTFGMSKTTARVTAHQWIEQAYRSHYMFPDLVRAQREKGG